MPLLRRLLRQCDQVKQIWWVSSFVRNRDSIGSRSVVLNETRSSHRPGWQRRYEGKASRSQILNVDVQPQIATGVCAVRLEIGGIGMWPGSRIYLHEDMGIVTE